MRIHRIKLGAIVGLALVLSSASCKKRVFNQASKSSEIHMVNGFEPMTEEQARGRDIWYKATAGNERYHTYALPQRMGAYIDWWKVLNTQKRNTRFKDWGVINDPECRPGDASSFGMDICPGDEDLLNYVGKKGYRDPACDLPQPPGSNREDPCKLAFGTSTGIVGFRKFPNPKFKRENWKGYENYKYTDGSIDPPFLIGEACAGCHVGFEPTRPPADKEHPKWENINLTVGNQFIHVSELTMSGLPSTSPLWQMFRHARPGTSDTSAVPHDEVNNPGTINALYNLDKRPTFMHDVTRSRRGPSGEWVHGTQKDEVLHILKGGEDSVGADLAVQRVYVNIGMCAEQCWLNHLVDPRVITSRGSFQTPFNIKQCRRDCSEWRAIEDHVGDLKAFLFSRRPTELKNAVDAAGVPAGKNALDAVAAKYQSKYAGLKGVGQGPHRDGVFEAGRRVYARDCAKCHSSMKPTLPGQKRDENFFKSVDFLAEKDGVRVDWLGNDERTPISEVQTNTCRALHANHSRGHVWEEFASNTFLKWPPAPGVRELEGKDASGRGYLRNISLINMWASAPFFHNNALGPELCSPFFTETQLGCVQPDGSVEARLKMFDESVRQLLNPAIRPKKVSTLDQELTLNLGIKMGVLENPTKLSLRIPKGTPVGLVGNMDERTLVENLLKKIEKQGNSIDFGALFKMMKELSTNPQALQDELRKASNCADLNENKGHEFGATLNSDDKEALIAFMMTL